MSYRSASTLLPCMSMSRGRRMRHHLGDAGARRDDLGPDPAQPDLLATQQRQHGLQHAETRRAYEQEATDRCGTLVRRFERSRGRQVPRAVAHEVPGNHAAARVCDDVHLEPGIAAVLADSSDQSGESARGAHAVQPEIVQVQVQATAGAVGRWSPGQAALVAAHALQRIDDSAIKIATQSFPEHRVGFGSVRIGLKRRRVDRQLEFAVVTEQQHRVRGGPDLATGTAFARLEPNAPGMRINGGWWSGRETLRTLPRAAGGRPPRIRPGRGRKR